MLKAAGRSREASLFNDSVIHLRTSQLCLKYVSFWPVAITPKEEADGALVQRASRDPRGSAMPPQSSLKAGGEERVGRRAIIGTELALTAAQPCADSSFILSWDVFHSKKQKKTCWAGCTAIAWIYFSSISWIVFLLDTGSLLAVQRNAEGALQQSTASADLFFRIFKPEVGMCLSCYSWRIQQRGFLNAVSQQWTQQKLGWSSPHVWLPSWGTWHKTTSWILIFLSAEQEAHPKWPSHHRGMERGIQSAQELRKIWQFSQGCKN